MYGLLAVIVMWALLAVLPHCLSHCTRSPGLTSKLRSMEDYIQHCAITSIEYDQLLDEVPRTFTAMYVRLVAL